MTARARTILLEQIVTIAAAAGDVVWEHFAAGCAIETKADESPVTAADRAAELVILAGLRKVAGHIPVVAEEELLQGGRVADQ